MYDPITGNYDTLSILVDPDYALSEDQHDFLKKVASLEAYTDPLAESYFSHPLGSPAKPCFTAQRFPHEEALFVQTYVSWYIFSYVRRYPDDAFLSDWIALSRGKSKPPVS